MKLIIPTGAAVVLSLIAGVLATLNQTSFSIVSPWHQLLGLALIVLTGIGVSPLTHSAFRTALHLTLAASVAITTFVMVAYTAVTTLSMSNGTKGVILGVLTVLAGLGFGPATGAVVGAVRR